MRWATVVLATVLILGSASFATAECAWVLWVKTTVLLSGDKNKPKPGWDLGNTFKNQPQCDHERRTHWEALAEIAEADVGASNVTKKQGEYVTRFFPKGGHISEVLYCLPDTIDPRVKGE